MLFLDLPPTPRNVTTLGFAILYLKGLPYLIFIVFDINIFSENFDVNRIDYKWTDFSLF